VKNWQDRAGKIELADLGFNFPLAKSVFHRHKFPCFGKILQVLIGKPSITLKSMGM